MKKIIIGAIIGGIIIFICQTLSWTILDLHRPANQYTPKQTEIMDFLNSQFAEDGSYILPAYPPDASKEDMRQYMKAAEGKPWAVISYHKQMSTQMGMNILRVLIVNILMIGLFCWILSKIPHLHFGRVLLISLIVGFIVFLNMPYTSHIWYETFDLNAYLIDSLVGWGLVGIWLGWLYGKKTRTA